MIGVRPSFEGRAGVVEKFRGRPAGGEDVWRAGTRKLGRVATGEDEARSRERLGASMVAVGRSVERPDDEEGRVFRRAAPTARSGWGSFRRAAEL